MSQKEFREAAVKLVEAEGAEVAIRIMAQMLGRMAAGMEVEFEIPNDAEGWCVKVEFY